MPVHMATDTKEALGATALKCESRPLFMDKFPEFAANEKMKQHADVLEA